MGELAEIGAVRSLSEAYKAGFTDLADLRDHGFIDERSLLKSKHLGIRAFGERRPRASPAVAKPVPGSPTYLAA